MEWKDSDPSDDENSLATSRKRSSRACDQCRKTKSKCERPSGSATQCKSCALTGTRPSYKRGPPKGYIHAIEQRWHQVESLLGAILQCPDARVQAFVNDLKQDDLASEIIDRVDMGPYGPAGRRSQPAGATKEDFFASILRSNGSNTRDNSRSRRQSRVSREIVSSTQDHGLSVVPTKEWQDNLSRRLASAGRNSTTSNTSYGTYRAPSSSNVPLAQRRRLNDTVEPPYSPDWSGMYTFNQEEPLESDEAKEATECMGSLSLDENQEIRYHGRISGLSLLERNKRTDDRMDGGIWRLPMARVWPPARYGLASPPIGEMEEHLPPWDIQDRLLELYFTYIHPVYPLIYKRRFLLEYQYKRQGTRRESQPNSPRLPRPEPTQEVTPLLLLAIFAIAARFCEDEMPLPPTGKMWEAGCGYLDTARGLLAKVFHVSRPSTVQALLLLGYREFGIGSMEQGWIFIGMAIRMVISIIFSLVGLTKSASIQAFDLGLNCDSSKWKVRGHDLFSAEDSQTRGHIWWACVLADRYGSIYMGRPTMIKDNDSDMSLPGIEPEEDIAPWQPHPSDGLSYSPTPGRIMSSFAAASRLSLISGTVINRVYPVQSISRVAKQAVLNECEAQLDQWLISLPDYLRCDSGNRRCSPSPQVIFLHIRYWGCVLLLYRAFIPNWKSSEDVARNSPIGSKALDLAQSAASHISSLVTMYRETFTLKRSSPFLTAYLLSASIMHILTLSLRSTHVEATLGLQQCMSALKDMEILWPSASRAWELLNGVKLSDGVCAVPLPQVHGQQTERQKRPADDAFGQEKNPEYPQSGVYERGNGTTNQNASGSQTGVHDLSTRIMAHMLGLDIQGIEPSSMSYYPGYQWWPGSSGQGESSTQHTSEPIHPPMSDPTQLAALPVGPRGTINTPANRNSHENWTYQQGQSKRVSESYSYDFSQFGP
ncbi:hypothetical protein AGABI1DRAFT_117526 [Agaricus bisporus var. burnettii JB137-S8]|uniref:Xylanolytic transcriptional activator regulatory domain-containing protein n=1 Tax=Agaricus bisporus var. burnettii (strain JB137-S8 / ATCC MYA-4627 / FGSC 10392) TaxID=597362 RepID=K5XL20_AGABU|nr:uncharacterized protein AGABI1DRAFT_117526 [Agaricus bisporus var. burnettii JB137-S8]EKM84077.1 hypothetical protein AGABI1DRAFT_117526 [Agaricus bisporus var. burnettii JB137-S8]